MNKVAVSFSAGCVGGLANSLVVWVFGYLGINGLFAVSILPTLSPEWLYPRIFWGGLWGLSLLLPFYSSKLILKGAVLSFLPTLVQLFVVFPLKADKGIAGLDLGLLTPVFVVLFNLIWGVVTAFFIRQASKCGS